MSLQFGINNQAISAAKDSRSNYLYLLGLVVCVIIISPLMKLNISQAPIYLSDVLIILLCLPLFIKTPKFSRKQEIEPISTETSKSFDQHIFFLTAATIPSAVLSVSDYGIVPVLFVYGRLSLAVGLYFAVRYHVRSRQDIDWLIGVAAVAGFISAIIGLIQIFQPDLWRNLLQPIVYWGTANPGNLVEWNEGIQHGLLRAYGGFLVPTVYAGSLIITFALSAYCALTKNRAWYIVVLVILVALFLTWSRHAYIILFVVFLPLWLLSKGITERKRRLLVIVILFASLPALLGFQELFTVIEKSNNLTPNTDPYERIASIFTPWNDTSFRARVDKYGLLLNYVFSDPTIFMFGTGYSYLQLSYKYTDISRSEATHAVTEGFASNSFLLNLHNFGMSSLIIFISLWIRLLILFVNYISRLQYASPISMTFCYIVLSLILIGLSDNYLHMSTPFQQIMWFSIALYINTTQIEYRPSDK